MPIVTTYSKDLFADYNLEQIPVYTVRIEFRVSNAENSGTDDPVYIQIGNSNTKYYLNKGMNDFQRGAYCYYSIAPANINKVSDINRLRIGKDGADQLRLHWVKLYINGEYTSWIFRKAFGSGGKIDNGSKIDIGEGELKNFRSGIGTSCRGRLPKFRINIPSQTIQFTDKFTIPDKIFEELIETAIGDAIHGNKLYWGGKDGDKYVGCWHKSGDRSKIHVSIDLKFDTADYSAPKSAKNIWSDVNSVIDGATDALLDAVSVSEIEQGIDLFSDVLQDALPDPEIDYSFDIRISCSLSDGKIKFTSVNQNIGGSIVTIAYASLYKLVESLDDLLGNTLKDFDKIFSEALSKLAFDLTLDFPAIDLAGYTFIATCPRIHVTDKGTIKFIWS